MKRLPGAESSVPREDNLPLIPEIKPAPDYSPGALIKGRYRVKERTCGSMGDVYHCQDTLRNSDVALNTVISSGRTEHRKVLSFKSEIDRIFRLPPHPNVLTLQRIEYIDGYYYLVIRISIGAFKDCRNLEELVISKNVRSIGEYALKNTPKLTRITVRTKMLTAGKIFRAFSGSGSFKGAGITVRVPQGYVFQYEKIFKGSGRLNAHARVQVDA